MLSVPLPPDLEARLDTIAAATGRSKAEHVIDAVLEHIQDLEDALVAAQRLDEVRAGRARTHDLDAVERDLGLED